MLLGMSLHNLDLVHVFHRRRDGRKSPKEGEQRGGEFHDLMMMMIERMNNRRLARRGGGEKKTMMGILKTPAGCQINSITCV